MKQIINKLKEKELTYGELPASIVDITYGHEWKLREKTGLISLYEVEKID